MPGVVAAALAFWAGLGVATPAHAQVSPEEHAEHHPAPAAPQPGTPMAAPQGGGMGQMQGMMEKMGAPPPKELFPSLMALPEDLSPEKRTEIERLAHERMKAGAAQMSRGLERMASSSGDEDYPAVQGAADQVREGLAQFESGLAAHRALREGKTPHAAALQWFKSQMNLAAAGEPKQPHGIFGLSWFHYFVMFLLTAFVAAVIWTYFYKMRRAANLLAGLTGGPVGGAAGAPARVAPAPAAAAPAAAPPTREFVSSQPWSGKLRLCQVFQETHD